MTDNETSSFRLGSEPIEESPESAAPTDALLQIRAKKSARRAVFTSLLLSLMMAVVFVWGYLDLKGRSAHQANTGNREIKNITAVFDDRLNEIDQKLITIHEQFGDDFAKLDKLTVKLQQNMDQLQKDMASIDLTGTMRKEKKAMLAEMQKTFAPIKKDIEGLSENMGAFDQRIRSQLEPLEKQIKQTRDQLIRLDKDHKELTDKAVNSDDLALEMLKIKKAYQQQILAESAAVRKQVSLLTERLERLESKLRAATPAPAVIPQTAVPGAGRGGIQEQNLP